MAQILAQRRDDVRSSSLQKPPRRLACRRCSRQKLQCRWEELGDQACIRCHRAGVLCTTSTPRRLGRPIQGHKSSAPAKGVGDTRKEQQEIGDEISFDFGSTPDDSGAQPIFPEWPAPVPLSGVNSVPDSDVLYIGGEMATQAATEESWSSNNSTQDLYSIGTMLDPRISVADVASIPDFQTLSPGLPHDPALSDCHHQVSPETPTSDVRRFWDLQMTLDAQLTRIRPTAEDGTTTTNDVSPSVAKQKRPQLPIDDIARSTHTFINLLHRSRPLAPKGDDATPQPSASPLATANLLSGMDTPTLCMVVSCYSRLMDVYDETFKYIKGELQGFSSHSSTCRLIVPSLQIGNFCLDDGYLLHRIIVVRVLLDLLRHTEKCMGIIGEHAVLRRESADPASQRNQGNGGRFDCPGGLSGTGDKISKVIMALEADGPGVVSRSTESLRRNIEIVQQHLECAWP
ncbi:putative C6 zinc finger domain-containing protein [Rosellinia necatrix]|uniref:Putative C6 zinc finger domain-containing protein n=1 Tax=Rosellinia necatrix TaxID=77044 RepID=A0A1S7UP39_ROSNE|nr:putative C6 zinc finger domain-containing protein [Rosellinia necatrix]